MECKRAPQPAGLGGPPPHSSLKDGLDGPVAVLLHVHCGPVLPPPLYARTAAERPPARKQSVECQPPSVHRQPQAVLRGEKRNISFLKGSPDGTAMVPQRSTVTQAAYICSKGRRSLHESL